MLRAKLFGVPVFTLDEQALGQALTGRRLALLAYLLSQEQPVSRSVLCDLLWADIGEERARENLRGLLSHTRRVVGDYLLVDRQQVAFNRAAPYWADLEVFGAFWSTGQTSVDPPLFTEVLQLYQGELLAGVYIQEAPRFEGWLLAQRQWWHGRAVHGWQQLAHHHFTQSDDRAGLLANERLLALEPWHEEAHRRQMLLLARSGQQEAALAHFDRCCAILREEVDAPPDEETVALYKAIKAGQWSPSQPLLIQPVTAADNAFALPDAFEPSAATAPPTVAPPSVVIDWGVAPHEPYFYGRQDELRRLHQWAVAEQRRVIAILGAGGQGKTALGVRFVRMLAEPAAASATAPGALPPFAQIIWRSLLAAPPLTALLQEWLQQLSGQQIVTLPHTVEQQFTLLHDYLQQRRFLLVLDNVESILLPDGSGACRAGYEAYEQLWQLFLQRDHQCCLLLTSREQPRVFTNHEEQLGLLRTLRLDGLAPDDGQAVLGHHGIRGQTATIATLVQRYSGNPLALKLVADMIEAIFGGNVAAFLDEESLFFDDISVVLAQQFARLSPLEVELLTWLALEQEPVTSQTLWENLVVPPSRRDFLTALRTLVRRALVQTQGDRFSLQNVILEYTRDRLVKQISIELTTDWPTGRQAEGVTDNQDEPSHPLTLSPPHPVTLSAFNRYALHKAQAKAYIGATQQRLLLQPLLDRLQTYWGAAAIGRWVQQTLITLRNTQQPYSPLAQGYAAANLLHLLLQSNIPLAGYDFSHLTLRQANLRDALLQGVDFTGVQFQGCRFTDSFASVTALAFHPNGELLAVGAYDGQLRLVRTADQQVQHVLPDHALALYGLAFSPDGTLIATSCIDQLVRVWDLTTQTVRYSFRETTNFVRTVAFSPDQRWLAVTGGDGDVRFYDAATGQLQHRLQSGSGWLWAVAFSPNGQWLVAGDAKGQIYLWSLAGWDKGGAPPTVIAANRAFRGHNGAVNTLVFRLDNQHFFSGGNDGQLHLWSIPQLLTTRPDQASPWHTLQGHQQSVRQLAIAPQGRFLASASADNTVRLWDAQEGLLLDTLVGHEQWVWAVAFHPHPTGGVQLLASGGNDQRVLLWEVTSQGGRPQSRLRQTLSGYSDAIYALAFTADGQTLISGGFDKLLHLWAQPGGVHRRTLSGHREWIFRVAASNDGRWLASSGYEAHIALWPALPDHPNHSPAPIELHGHDGAVWGLAFSPDSQLLASCSRDATIRLWDVRAPTARTHPVAVLTGHTGYVWGVAFSPDGRWLASAGWDQTVRLWDVQQLTSPESSATTNQCWRRTFSGHTGYVWQVAFSPDGQTLISVSHDQTVRLWDVSSERCRVLTGHTNTVRSLAVSPAQADGRYLIATSDDDKIIRLWDGQSGEVRHILQGHRGVIHSLAFSVDGALLASASHQGGIRLWDVQSGAHVQTLRAPRPYTGMKITGVTGITPAQKAALLALGAVEGG